MAEALAQDGPALIEVLPNHRFDEAALVRYLGDRLPGFSRGCVVRQFQGGQSNPTFHLATPEGAMCFARSRTEAAAFRPAVDREYRILKALWPTDVPTRRFICSAKTRA